MRSNGISDASDLQPHPILLAGLPVQRVERLEIASPWSCQPTRIVSQADSSDAEVALRAADASFSITRNLSSWQRYDILQRISDLISRDAELLSQLITIEAGKSIKDSRQEVSRAVQTFKVAAEEAKRIGGEIIPLDWTPGPNNEWQ